MNTKVLETKKEAQKNMTIMPYIMTIFYDADNI